MISSRCCLQFGEPVGFSKLAGGYYQAAVSGLGVLPLSAFQAWSAAARTVFVGGSSIVAAASIVSGGSAAFWGFQAPAIALLGASV
jgi:hypothetical protein